MERGVDGHRTPGQGETDMSHSTLIVAPALVSAQPQPVSQPQLCLSLSLSLSLISALSSALSSCLNPFLNPASDLVRRASSGQWCSWCASMRRSSR